MILKFCGGQRILHQHRNRHRPYAAGNGRDERTLGGNGIKIHIAAEFAVFIPVHTNVYYNGAVLYHIRRDKLGFADSGNKNIRRFCYLF